MRTARLTRACRRQWERRASPADSAAPLAASVRPRYEDAEAAWEILEKVHSAIFENELCGWHTDEAAWPSGRDFATFKDWFEIELHSVVEDLCDCEIVDEDDEG